MGFFDFFKKKKLQPTSPAKQPASQSHLDNTPVKVTVSFSMPSANDVIPVETKTKNAFPSRNGGLYPHEILVLDYANSYSTKNNTYQRFWWNRYGIKDVDTILKSLLQKGFICVGSVQETLGKKTVVELKKILENNALKTTGKKTELIQRIVESIPESDLEALFPIRPYVRTEKGNKELADEEYVSYIHRNSVEDLDIWSLNRLLYGSSVHIPYRDVIWGYLNKKSGEYFSANDFGLYRNCRYRMAAFLKEEGKFEGALTMLAEVVFYDLTGAGNNYKPELLYMHASFLFPYEQSLAKTYPGITKEIFACQEKVGFSEEELRGFLVEKMKELYTPLQLFSVNECVDIIFYEQSSNKEALEQLYKVAEKRFHKNHPNLKKNPYA